MLLALSLIGTAFADDAYITVDGVKISKDEYIKLLERTTVSIPGGQQAKAERLVVDQIVSNIVILREATKAGLVPTEEAVERFYRVQKRLMEAQQPGKNYESELASQGMTPDELKADLKVQMAETALYARKLKLGDTQIRAAYNKEKVNIGLPASTHLRLIVLQPNTPEVKRVIALLKASNPFEAVADTINEPSLKATGGERVLFDSQIPAAVLQEVKVAKAGGIIGPVKWVTQPESGKPLALTAWIKVISRQKGFSLEYADAAPILLRDLVREKIANPANAAKRDEILKIKMGVTVESEDPIKGVVWDDIKKAAREMGVGG